MTEQPKRKSYTRINEMLMQAAGNIMVTVHAQPWSCRVAINAGLELLLAGLEHLKDHGIDRAAIMEFVELALNTPGDIDDMTKGGKHERLLRMAMQMINGRIVTHRGSIDAVIDGVKPEPKKTQLAYDPKMN